MSSWDDYYEPSEFDELVEEFKQSIIDNVRDQLKNKIKMLEEENAKFDDIKKNWKQMQREHEQALYNLRVKTENAEREAKRQKAKDILDSIAVIGYRPGFEYTKLPKCDKCDDMRRIHFTSPLGREMTEPCTCDKGIKSYFPKEEKLIGFYANETISDMYFSCTDRDREHWELRADIYKQLPDDLSKINSYRAVFFSKEDCQKYCDWLMENEE